MDGDIRRTRFLRTTAGNPVSGRRVLETQRDETDGGRVTEEYSRICGSQSKCTGEA